MPTPVYDGIVYDEGNLYEMDSRLRVEFFMTPVQHQLRTLEEGRPIFVERPCVRIFTPGSKDVMVTRATGPYTTRFPKQWDAFCRGQEYVTDGTPIDQVPFLTVGQVAELKAVNVMTLEQLANMPDNLAQKFMGHYNMRQRAQNFLAAAAKDAPVQQMQAALEERDEQIRMLSEKLEAFIAAQETPKKAPVAATA